MSTGPSGGSIECGYAVECLRSGNSLSTSPPSENAAASKDKAGQARTHDRARNRFDCRSQILFGVYPVRVELSVEVQFKIEGIGGQHAKIKIQDLNILV